ncbi:cation:proton antiporter family protein [Nocardioides bruguierae]|uniref:cation:proton antiporter family protein n=1 Tax=Nocardioides bruguierae TaxID=2945102 RepID=UPI00202245DF|nr:cation:proton antiporter family protein [Nocardioides bruguierae]MCL8024309.1 cation:proton antiporter [Nocardioides bruguierae]
MDPTSITLLAALAGGLTATALRLPPLLGFLAAGFVLHGLGVPEVPVVSLAADLGVTLLLFSVGLKVNVRTLVRREVLGVGALHMVLTTALVALVLVALGLTGWAIVGGTDWRTAILVGFSLSFASTVFVVKVLEEQSGSRSLAGRTAIGILVLQDLAAVVFLTASHGSLPGPEALLVLLLLPGSLVLRRVLDRLGHAELRPLFGVVLALVPGYALFDAVGLKGDLGALAIGMLLASHPGSEALSKSLLSVKDLFLVGFFLSIGFTGIPDLPHLLIALGLVALIPLRGLALAWLLWWAGLRRRTSVVTATAMANYSEFALIVAVAAPASLLGPEWVGVLATAIAVSFVLGTVTRHPEWVVRVTSRLMPDRPSERLHPDDRPVDVGHHQAVVLGMGRVGRSAYERLAGEHGLSVVGVENSVERAEKLRADGLDVVEGDATDPEFWDRVRTGDVAVVLLAMPFHGNNIEALSHLRGSGYEGTVAVVAQQDSDLEHARRAGAATGLQLYDGAGAELADRAVRALPGA